MSACVNGAINRIAFKAPEASYKEDDVCLLEYEDNGKTQGTIATLFLLHTDSHVYSTSNINKFPLSTSLQTILYSHGNAVDVGDTLQYGTWLALFTGCNVVLWDYAFYGQSVMKSSASNAMEASMYDGVKAVFQNIRATVPQHDLFLMGKSLGTVPTIWLANKLSTDFMPENNHVCGVVVISPLASGARTMCDMNYIPESAISFMDSLFADSLDRVAAIRIPMLVLHGRQDIIVPFQNARDLLSNISSETPCTFHAFDWAGHNDIETRYTDKFVHVLCKFLDDNTDVGRQKFE